MRSSSLSKTQSCTKSCRRGDSMKLHSRNKFRPPMTAPESGHSPVWSLGWIRQQPAQHSPLHSVSVLKCTVLIEPGSSWKALFCSLHTRLSGFHRLRTLPFSSPGSRFLPAMDANGFGTFSLEPLACSTRHRVTLANATLYSDPISQSEPRHFPLTDAASSSFPLSEWRAAVNGAWGPPQPKQ
jgi:hypothetical protein